MLQVLSGFNYKFSTSYITQWQSNYWQIKLFFFRIPIVNVLSEKEQRRCGRSKRSTSSEGLKNGEAGQTRSNEMRETTGSLTNDENSNSRIEIKKMDPPQVPSKGSRLGKIYDTDIVDLKMESVDYDCGEFCGDYDYGFDSSEAKDKHDDFGGFGKVLLAFQNYLSFATLDRCQKDVAYKIPLDRYCDIVKELEIKCFEQSLLEIWNYDENLLTELTTEDIISAIKRYDRSPYFGYAFEYTLLLGGMKYNSQHELVSASAIMYNFPTTVDLDQIKIVSETKNAGTEFDPLDANNLLWQEKAIEVGK